MKTTQRRRILALGLAIGVSLVGCTSNPSPTTAGQTTWSTDFASAEAKAKASNRPILAVFSTSWCSYCKKMDENVWPLPAVQTALEPFVVVKVDGDKNPKLTEKYMISGYPTVIALDSKSQLLGAIEGYAEEGRLVENLKIWATARVPERRPQ